MKTEEAIELLADAVPVDSGGTWADLGAGDGTFTLALARLLGPESHIIAVDQDRGALRELERRAMKAHVHGRVTTVTADFTSAFELPAGLHGLLLANSLHYVRDPKTVLARLVESLNARGRVVFVEYDRRAPNPWVPYPIDAHRLPALCADAGLSAPVITARRPSEYGGELYVAIAVR